MPLASAVHFLSAASATDGLYKVLACGLVVALIASVRSWSKGYVCVEERELAGRTFIIDVRPSLSLSRSGRGALDPSSSTS